MSAENYAASLHDVLEREGGYINHRADPGGPTMRGVTQATYDAFRKRQGQRPRDVRSIDDGELQAIYRRQFWNGVHGDDLPAGVDLAVFDYAVNSGASRAAQSLQAVLGVTPDGQIGEKTLAAVRARPPAELVQQLCERRLAFMQRLKTWPVFGKGWARRVAIIRRQAAAMTIAGPEPQRPPVIPPLSAIVPPHDEPFGKAMPTPDTTGKTDTAVIAATGASGLLAAVIGAVDSPWGLAALALLIAAAGVAAWRLWPRPTMPELETPVPMQEATAVPTPEPSAP